MADSQTPEPAPRPEDPASDPDPRDLSAEARYLHSCLFAFPIPDSVLERYVAAHEHLEFREDVDLSRVIDRRLDAEAIEFFLRRRSPQNALTQKLRTLLYLVEIEAEYYSHFVRDEGSLLTSLPGLLLSPLRSACKLLKGAFQTRRHHVA